MEVGEAFDRISNAIDSGRAAHGYLIVGDIRGNAQELAERILEKLFPEGHEQLVAKTHPDVAMLFPEGKAREIKIDSIRAHIIKPMAATSYSGGWKVGVIYGVDRLNQNASNAFLKSLEEPTPKTMYLMITDRPDGLLPTIISRSQRVDLPLPEGIVTDSEIYAAMLDAFNGRDAAALTGILKEMKDSVEDSEVALARKQFFKTIMKFAREIMIENKVPRYLAFRNIEAVEDAFRQVEKSMNDEMVIAFMLDRITLP